MLQLFKSICASRFCWFLLFLSGIALEACGLYFQYELHLNPCVNCVYERAYFLGFVVAGFIGAMAANYVIVRFPLVLCDLTCEPFIYTVKKDNLVSCITKEDGAYAVCKILDNLDKVNKKEINLGNIECKYEDILNNILKCHGLSFNYILSRIFLSKDMSFPILNDSKKYEKILEYSSDSLDSYFMRQKRRSRHRKINILLGKFILLIKKGR